MRPVTTKLTLRVLTLLLPILLVIGCAPAKRSGSNAAPGGYDDHDDYRYDYGGSGGGAVGGGGGGAVGGDGEMGFDAPEPEAEDVVTISAESGPSFGERMRAKKKQARNENRREARDAGAAYEPPAEPAPEPAPGSEITVDALEPEQPEQPEQQAAAKRQIIYTATMQVQVFDLERAIAEAEALPERLGGWLHERRDNQLVLRIPAEQLEHAMDTIAELGVVDYRLLEALDVTAEYTDLESRIRVLEQTQAQLRALLEQAKNVEQALEIRQALDAVTLELELARAQMRELAKSIAFSTLILRFVQRGPAVDVPSSNDPFPWVDQLGVEATEYR